MLAAVRISILFFVSGVALCQRVGLDDEKPFLRILAPKFICNEKKANVTTQSNNITIGLQTREGQKLRYKIVVDFEMLGGFKSQQHTLSIWKNIRMLQKKFTNISDEISLKNQIEINAQELTSQVIYTFRIVGFDDKNRSSEVQNFSITFKGGELKAFQPDIGDGVSLLLFSSEFFYDDMEILAVAEVLFCNPINDFTYQWSVEGLNSSDVGSILGRSLRLPPGTIASGKSIMITVKILNNETLTMASATIPVDMLSKEFQLESTPSACSVGTSREVMFQALISRQPNAESILVKWSCSHDGSDCSQNFVNSSGLSQIISFAAEGNYELQSEVSIIGVSKTSSTKITVDAKVISHVQIKYFPSQPINVMQSNEVVMTVLNLVPKCVAYWNIVAGDGFAEFKSGAEGNLTDMGYTFVKDFEEYFLQELVDYDNNTLSKDITLSLPAGVLQSNAKYKFRLTTTCPQPMTDSTQQQQPANVTSFNDIIVNTNGPPETLPLIVNPAVGIPMKRMFKFSTGAAKDSSSNFPLKYSFGYIVSNLTIVIGSFYENTVAHTQLPFSDAIETFCEICDNNGACKVIAGPTVKVNVETKYSNEEIAFKMSEFEATLRRAEYSQSMNVAVVFLSTQRKALGDTSAYETKMLSMMKQELERLKSSEGSGFIYQQSIIEFVKMSKNLMGIMTTSDESFVDELLKTTETINRSAKRVKRAFVAEAPASRVMSHDTDYIKNVLSLSEILLNSINQTVVQQEKINFMRKVRQFVTSMCQDKNLNSQMIKSKFVTFEVSKVFSPQLSLDPQRLRTDSDEPTILFSQNGNFPAKYVCVAKLRFSIDMLQVSPSDLSPVYETLILDGDGKGAFKAVPINQIADSIIAEMPSSQSDAAMTCFMWNGSGWSSDECSKQKSNATDRVACKCRTSQTESVIMKAGKMPLKPTATSHTTGNSDVTSEKPPTTVAFTFLSTRTTPRVEVTSSVATFTESQMTQPTQKIDLMSSHLPSVPQTADDVSPFPAPISTSSPLTSLATSAVSIAMPMTTPNTLSSPPAPSVGAINFPQTSTAPLIAPVVFSQPTDSESIKALTSAASVLPTKASSLTKDPDKPAIEVITVKTTTNSTNENLGENRDASVSWTFIALLLVFFAIIVVLFSAHKCRKYIESRVNLPMRSPSNGIKYARYHDEFTMQG